MLLLWIFCYLYYITITITITMNKVCANFIFILIKDYSIHITNRFIVKVKDTDIFTQ